MFKKRRFLMIGNSQHLWELSAKLFSDDGPAHKRWLARCLDRLDQGKVEAPGKIPRESQPANPELAKTVTNEAQYFQRNAERMRYPSFHSWPLRAILISTTCTPALCAGSPRRFR